MLKPLTIDEVERIAELARLDLTDEEKALFSIQLAEILSYAQKIQKVNTSEVPPTAHALESQLALRSDTTKPSLKRVQVLANAPEPASDTGLFKVPKVIS